MPKMLHLSQRHPDWALVKIGKTNLSVGNWGCALTGASMLSSYFGCYLSPKQLAKFPGLFTADGLIKWPEFERVFNGKMKFVWRQSGRDDKRIRESINNSPKTAVLLQVNYAKHWVVAVAVAGNDYWIVDPIDGKKKLLSKAYPNITASVHLIGA